MVALECVCRDVVGDPRATLGDILKSNPRLAPEPLDPVPERKEVELIVGLAATLATYLRRRQFPCHDWIAFELAPCTPSAVESLSLPKRHQHDFSSITAGHYSRFDSLRSQGQSPLSVVTVLDYRLEFVIGHLEKRG